MQPIETHYAGCRFRSRLEARWAVFFDRLGLKWLYEPQGYRLGSGDLYLPDFWLPEQSLWVEVKGAATEEDGALLHAACSADGLPLTYEDGRPPAEVLDERELSRLLPVPRLVLLGEVPRPSLGGLWLHRLGMLSAVGASVQDAAFSGKGRVLPVGTGLYWQRDLGFDGKSTGLGELSHRVTAAYAAARSARFEHGEAA